MLRCNADVVLVSYEAFPYSRRICTDQAMNIRRLYRNSLMYLGSKYKNFLYADACIRGKNTRLMNDATIENLQNNPNAIALGSSCLIRGHLLVWKHAGNIQVGDYCFIGQNTEIWSMASVTIGNRVLIAHGVNIVDSNAHSKSSTERHQHYRLMVEQGHPKEAQLLGQVSAEPVIIEDDVWISFGCTILKGVRIGARSIIAAGTVVTKDIPPDSICMSYNQLQIKTLDTV